MTALFNTIDDPEVKDFRKIEEGYYLEPETGLAKRYFSVESLENFTEGKFETIILDNKGETYKDEIHSLIRFVGRKVAKPDYFSK